MMEAVILVKFLAQSGHCSRRKAEELIKYKHVQVNNKIIDDPTFLVQKDDVVVCGEQVITIPEYIYVMLNKPAGCITSKSDPSGRPTVMDFIPEQLATMLDPVGRLDFHTSGVLLLTNDGDLAFALSHPKHNISKTYEVTASRPLDIEIIETIRKGVKLEDCFIRPDRVQWHAKKPTQLKLTLHSGKNRVIKRILEQLRIFVKKLHRSNFAGIEIGNLRPGEWRKLNKKEIALLKKLN